MIVVTGGAGFIGSCMVWRLNQAGITDIVVVDEFGDTEKWKNLVGLRFNDYIHKDIFLTKLLSEEFPAPMAIIHLGANSATTEKNVDSLMETNFSYSKDLCLFSVTRGVRFIYASSAATYGDGSAGYQDDLSLLQTLRPLNAYGYSKHLFDLWAARRNFDAKTVGLKFFNVFGPNEYHKGDMSSVVFKAFEQIQSQGRVRLFKSHREDIRDGEQMRDFVYVKDCCEVMYWLLEHPEVNGIFNLGTGHARSFYDLALATFSALGKAPQIDFIPMPSALQGKYQYFTEAAMGKLTAAGCPVVFRSLEDSVKDYVQHYLNTPTPYLTLNNSPMETSA